jgi:hypothetical protein
MKDTEVEAREVNCGGQGNASFSRVRGEGRDEGAFPPGSDSRRRPLTPPSPRKRGEGVAGGAVVHYAVSLAECVRDK